MIYIYINIYTHLKNDIISTTPSQSILFLGLSSQTVVEVRYLSGAVFCDCSIIDHSKDLPPLRIFLGDRPFELPVAEMFSKIPTKDGGSHLSAV